MNMDDARRSVVEAACRLGPLGLTQGTSGNVSLRAGRRMLVTPSAVPYDSLEPDDVVLMDLDGSRCDAREGRRPSTEWRLHAAVLATREDIGAIVHAHPPWSTALSCLRRGIPAFHYMVAVAGGSEIACSSYERFGTPELAMAATEALGPRRACLLANHGIVSCGADLAGALSLAVEVETLAGQFMRALAVGEPVLLDDTEMAGVLAAFSDYGG